MPALVRLPSALILPLLAVSLTSAPAADEELSSSDRDNLLESLDTLRDSARATRNERYRTARTTFQEAIGNPQRLMQVFYDSVRMVDFERQGKPGSEYRAWEEQFQANLDKDKLQTKLRYQLRWLLLMMQAEVNQNPPALAGDCLGLVRELMAEATANQGLLAEMGEGATGSVIARAFDLDSLEIEGMPAAPLPLQPVFELALKPARQRKDFAEMRSLWNERVSLEGRIVENSVKEDEKLKDNQAARDFALTTRPNLLWQMEVDCFKAGDERTSAANLLGLLRDSDSTSQALKWESELRGLVDPGAADRETRQRQAAQSEAAENPAPAPVVAPSRRGRPPTRASGSRPTPPPPAAATAESAQPAAPVEPAEPSGAEPAENQAEPAPPSDPFAE